LVEEFSEREKVLDAEERLAGRERDERVGPAGGVRPAQRKGEEVAFGVEAFDEFTPPAAAILDKLELLPGAGVKGMGDAEAT
jgi:hypothetical protein